MSWARAVPPPASTDEPNISSVPSVRRMFMIPLAGIEPLRYRSMDRRFFILLLAAVCLLAPFSPASSQEGPDPDVAATVKTVIAAARHPELTWPEIPDVVAILKELYDAEPDRLLWFTGTQPAPGVASVVRGLA